MDQKDLTIVCISDTHTNQYKLLLPPGDILIHAGDFSLSGTGKEIEQFAQWLDMQDFKHKIVIAGNHDITLDFATYEQFNQKRFHGHYKVKEDPVKIKDRLKQSCTYLENESTTIEGYKFYGSPYSLEYCTWGFQIQPGQPSELMWQQIPTDTDVVITHGPPFGIRDVVQNMGSVGCPILAQHINERVKPKYHIFGHIHECYGQQTHGQTTYVNAASCNLQYKAVNAPIVLSLPRNRL